MELRDGRLIWVPFTEVEDDIRRAEEVPKDLLMRFIRLAEADAEQIREFAERWGPLWICKHELPYTHAAEPLFPAADFRYWCKPQRTKSGEFWEPISVWRYFARQAKSALRITGRLHQNKVGLRDDWNVIYEPDSDGKGNGHGSDIGDDKFSLTMVVNQWLELGNVRPKFRWWGEHMAVSFDGHLFSTLACQLMMVISRTKGLGICSACGEPFVPEKRRPKAEQRNYCKDCGRRAACRDAQRARRRRLKERA
jgi:hypothetical protein